MFTGLIEAVGELVENKPTGGGSRVRVRTEIAAELQAGESVAVNGVCLTAVESTRSDWIAEVGPETTRVTALGSLRPGSLVNLERPVRANGRFGGHLVLGHVDGVGTIHAIRPEADFYWVTISYPGALTPYLIHRGSVALDGISLTVARLDSTSLDLQIVPFTWTHTNLHAARVGDRVNLECDMVGKYVLRAFEQYAALHPSSVPAP
jgi:riboflavin synthase